MIGSVDVIGMIGITPQIELIQNQLSATSARHNIASQNIANVNTPGFKSMELASVGDPETGTETYESVESDRNSLRLDGNTVDIHHEMGVLKRNSLLHNVYTQVLASKLRQLERAITPP